MRVLPDEVAKALNNLYNIGIITDEDLMYYTEKYFSSNSMEVCEVLTLINNICMKFDKRISKIEQEIGKIKDIGV